jgi:hypothetical protein
MILVTRHPGRARALEQLAVEPVIGGNDGNRSKSQALDPDLFEQHHEQPLSSFGGAHEEILAQNESGFPIGDKIADARRQLGRYRQWLQPSMLGVSPRPDTFDVLRGSTFDGSPFLFDPGGNIIINALGSDKNSSKWQEMLLTVIEGARRGIDLPKGPHRGKSLNNVLCARTPFLIHLDESRIGDLMLHPIVNRLLEVAILIPTAPVGRWMKPAFYSEASKARSRYLKVVTGILKKRSDNTGLEIVAPFDPDLLDGMQRLETSLDRLPERVRRHCNGLYDLPFRLMWTAMALDGKAAAPRALTQGVLLAANWCANQQIALIKETLETNGERRLISEAIAIFERLQRLAPCTMRDRLRTFSNQTRAVHEPAVNLLCDRGVVHRDGNRLELPEDAQLPRWLHSGYASN